MLKHQLLHPQVLEALGRAGHGSKVLIADGNYPASTTLGRNATLVNLNFTPGLLSCTQVLEVLTTAIPIEAASVMAVNKEGPYALKEDPPIWDEFRTLLKGQGPDGGDVALDPIERFAFYDTAGQPDVALTIATGEQRIYANLLLTLGVVKPR